MAGRQKHPLGDLFGLANIGVNLTHLAPNAVSALRHAQPHDAQIYAAVEWVPIRLLVEVQDTFARESSVGVFRKRLERNCALIRNQ